MAGRIRGNTFPQWLKAIGFNFNIFNVLIRGITEIWAEIPWCFIWNFHIFPKLNVNRLSSICYQKNDSRQLRHDQVFMRDEDLLKEDIWDFLEWSGKDLKEMGSDSLFSKGGEMFLGQRRVNFKLLKGWVKGKLLLRNVIYLLYSKVFTILNLTKYKEKEYLVIRGFGWWFVVCFGVGFFALILLLSL